MKNETTPIPEVYAVFAMGNDYYDQLELVKIFGSMAAAEEHAAGLRLSFGNNAEGNWQGPQPEYALVKVEPWSVN